MLFMKFKEIISDQYFKHLILLIIIGSILRLYNIGFNSLWLDEASTNTFALMSIPNIWNATIGGEFNPPLFYWLEHFIIILQNSETTLRLIPAICGILTIPAIYYAGKEFLDHNIGIISAAAFTFSPFLISYSQEARAYSMMLFFITLSMIFYFKAMKNNTAPDWCLFGMFSALAFWTHFYAFVIFASLIIYTILNLILNQDKNFHNIKLISLPIIVFTILCSPLILMAIKLFTLRTSSTPTFGMQGLNIITETFYQISGSSEISMFLFSILFIIGIVGLLFNNKEKGSFLIITTIIVFIISFILSYKMPMVPKYLIFFNIIFFIGIASSYKILYLYIKNPKIIYGIMALFVIISAPNLVNYYSNQSKTDWRGFSSQIQNITNDGDIIVLLPGYLYQPFDYYYSNSSDKTLELMATYQKELDQINIDYQNNTIYFIITDDLLSANPDGTSLAWIKKYTKSALTYNNIYTFKRNFK